jgi:hypothetical protein
MGFVVSIDDADLWIRFECRGKLLQPAVVQAYPGIGESNPVVPGGSNSYVAPLTRGRIP